MLYPLNTEKKSPGALGGTKQRRDGRGKGTQGISRWREPNSSE